MERAAEGNPDWDTTLANCQSTTDFPACTYWRELMEYSPEAKVILTVRDPESWYESVHATIDGLLDRDAMIDSYARRVATVLATSPSR